MELKRKAVEKDKEAAAAVNAAANASAEKTLLDLQTSQLNESTAAALQQEQLVGSARIEQMVTAAELEALEAHESGEGSQGSRRLADLEEESPENRVETFVRDLPLDPALSTLPEDPPLFSVPFAGPSAVSVAGSAVSAAEFLHLLDDVHAWHIRRER